MFLDKPKTFRFTQPNLRTALSAPQIAAKPTTMNDSSKLIIEQRIRNRIIEYLQMVDEFETDPPPFDLNELINQWNDWVESPTYADQFPPPIYSAREAEQLCSVATSLDQLCDATPQIIVDQSDCLQLPEWAAFVLACRSALAEMQVRGRLPEN